MAEDTPDSPTDNGDLTDEISMVELDSKELVEADDVEAELIEVPLIGPDFDIRPRASAFFKDDMLPMPGARETLPGSGDKPVPHDAPPSKVRRELTLQDLERESPSVFRQLTPLSTEGDSAAGPPATPPSAASAPTLRQLPPIPPEVVQQSSIMIEPWPQSPPNAPEEIDHTALLGEATEVFNAVPETVQDDEQPPIDRRRQPRAIYAVIALALAIFPAVIGIQMGARLTGGERRGVGGVLADRISNHAQARPRRARVRQTPVVAQRPVQAPVLRPVSPPRAPTPPPVAIVHNPAPTPTAALPRCVTNDSFASEAEAVRQGYTLVVLFPGQTRIPSTPVCRPE